MLATNKDTIQSVYLCSGSKRDDYWVDLDWLAENCPLVTDVEIPFHSVTDAVRSGRFSEVTTSKVEDLAVSYSRAKVTFHT
jgi:hypothetical protein